MHMHLRNLATVAMRMPREVLSVASILRLNRTVATQGAAQEFLDRGSCPAGLLQCCKRIHVLQGECAHVSLPHEGCNQVLLSSDEATTCCVMVLHCPHSNVAFIAHQDECAVNHTQEVQAALQRMLEVRCLCTTES